MLSYKTIVSDVRLDEATGLYVPDHERGIISVQEDCSRSFVKQFLQILLGCYRSGGLATVQDTGNVTRTPNQIIRTGAAITVDTYGIVVGSGTTAVTASDYALATKIAHGTGAGQLSYAAEVQDTDVTVAGAVVSFNESRVFTNGSAGAIDVKEIGVYAWDSSFFYDIIRDVLTATDNVPVGKAYTVIYQTKTTA